MIKKIKNNISFCIFKSIRILLYKLMMLTDLKKFDKTYAMSSKIGDNNLRCVEIKIKIYNEKDKTKSN